MQNIVDDKRRKQKGYWKGVDRKPRVFSRGQQEKRQADKWPWVKNGYRDKKTLSEREKCTKQTVVP